MTATIKAELAGENLSSLVRIKVRTSNSGLVTLGGTAKSRDAAYRAAAIARSVNGVSAVDNRIRIVARN
jgi:osmotically-inducible protein OsmY